MFSFGCLKLITYGMRGWRRYVLGHTGTTRRHDTYATALPSVCGAMPSTNVTSTVQSRQRTFLRLTDTRFDPKPDRHLSKLRLPRFRADTGKLWRTLWSFPSWFLPSFSWWAFHLIDVFSIFMAVNIPVLVFCVMTPCSLVGWYG